MKISPLVIIAIFFFSCSDKENRPSVATDKFKSAVPDRSGGNYFPTDSLIFSSVSKSKILDSFVRESYSEILYNLREPVLYNYFGEGQSIRILWLRPFNNHVVVRLNNFDDTVYVNIKELKIKSSQDEVAEIVNDTVITLDVKKWQESLSRLEAASFWNAITEDTSSNTVKDGTSWILECRLPNKYHCINRSNDNNWASKEIKVYAKELLEIGESYVRMKHSR